MTIILYSTDCPKCKVLKSKLDSKGIEYNVISDVDIMTSKGIDTVPVLEINGEMMNFKTLKVDELSDFVITSLKFLYKNDLDYVLKLGLSKEVVDEISK